MSKQTNIQWCDGSSNPVMGCEGCELYLSPPVIFRRIDRACIETGCSDWKLGTAESIFQGVLKNAWSRLLKSGRRPGIGHRNVVTSTNLRHLRRRFKQAVTAKFSSEIGQIVISIIEQSLSCYAALLHANRGYDIENPQRKVNPGYAPTFEQITQYSGRLQTAAGSSDLTGLPHPEKPWLDGLPRLIFVSDMGDAFSRKADFQFLRNEVTAITSVEGQRHLWLWLTKRPRLMRQFADTIDGFPPNVCAMTTVTSEKTLSRIDDLRKVNAAVRGLSLEPLWAPLADKIDLTDIDWVIVGGESGARANVHLFPIEWAIELRDVCREKGVAFFMKQFGRRPTFQGKDMKLKHQHGGDWSEWPEDLRVREMPQYFYDYGSLK